MNYKKGQSLIEILIVIALTAILLPALFYALMASREARPQQNVRLRASELLKETQDTLRVIRESGWNAVSSSGTFHPERTGNTWMLVSGTDTSNGISRQIVISNVNRLNNQIVTSGGIPDPSTKQAVITVSWNEPLATSISSTMYITRYLENGVYIQTTKAEFDTGTKSNTMTTLTADGEVTLAANVKGKWCEPQIAPVTIDLPGLPRAVSAVEGHIYAATGQTADAATDSFAHVLVANTDPPSFSLHGKFKGYQTNAVFGEPNWGYIATTNNSKEIVIIDLNTYSDIPNKIYQEEGYFNTPSSGTDADTIFIFNNRGYMTAGNRLYVFNLSSKSGSRSQIGSSIQFANSGDIANEIYVRQVGSSVYAYIAIEGSTVEEMKIANVTNNNISSQWRIISGLNIEPNNCSTLESGQAIFVNTAGDRAYLSSVNDTTFKEFFVINTSNKSSLSLVGGFATNPPCTNGGGYEAGGMNPEQSAVVTSLLPNDRAVLVGTDAAGGANTEEYQVLNVSSEAAPFKCGGLQYDVGIYGVAAVKETDGDAYAYIITGDNTNELKVIQGGIDGAYVDQGTYESSTFDTTPLSKGINYFAPTFTEQSGVNNIDYQIAVADPIAGSCNGVTFTFVGPNGTSDSSDRYTGADGIYFDDNGVGYENPGQCFRYKAFFSTTNYNSTPVLERIVINTSP